MPADCVGLTHDPQRLFVTGETFHRATVSPLEPLPADPPEPVPASLDGKPDDRVIPLTVCSNATEALRLSVVQSGRSMDSSLS